MAKTHEPEERSFLRQLMSLVGGVLISYLVMRLFGWCKWRVPTAPTKAKAAPALANPSSSSPPAQNPAPIKKTPPQVKWRGSDSRRLFLSLLGAVMGIGFGGQQLISNFGIGSMSFWVGLLVLLGSFLDFFLANRLLGYFPDIQCNWRQFLIMATLMSFPYLIFIWGVTFLIVRWHPEPEQSKLLSFVTFLLLGGMFLLRALDDLRRFYRYRRQQGKV